MKSLLNNPKVTVSLAVLACVVLAWRLVGLFRPGLSRATSASVAASGTSNVVAQAGTEAGKGPFLALGLGKRASIRTNYASWLQAPQRNPFLRVAVEEPAVAAPKLALRTSDPPPPPPLPALSGILRSGRGQLAILDGKVLGRGGAVGTFTLMAIGEGEVTVRDAQGVETVLGLPGSPASRRAPKTLAPASAALPKP